jgi:signal transduction histidine kinase
VLAPIKSVTVASGRLAAGDLSHRVKVNDRGEIGAMAQSFNTMASELDRNRTLQHNMIADIAHELRTPVSNIRGNLEAVQDGLALPNADTINSLAEETSLLTRLIDDLQELSLAEAGQLKLKLERVEPASVILRVVEAFRIESQSKGVKLEAKLGINVPLVEIDTQRIFQVLSNLVRNSLAHTRQGDSIIVSSEAIVDKLVVSVTDTGEGIPESDLPLIFERFYRVDKSRSRATGGTGLGLTIVKKFVEAHKGSVEVKSEVGTGTTFNIVLPLVL